jgi:DNA primase small subunit
VNSNLEVADLADGKHTGADPAAFQRREFCFTLDNDIFVRYQSFKV